MPIIGDREIAPGYPARQPDPIVHQIITQTLGNLETVISTASKNSQGEIAILSRGKILIGAILSSYEGEFLLTSNPYAVFRGYENDVVPIINLPPLTERDQQIIACHASNILNKCGFLSRYAYTFNANGRLNLVQTQEGEARENYDQRMNSLRRGGIPDLQKLCGIGKIRQKVFENLGIHTIVQLANMPIDKINAIQDKRLYKTILFYQEIAILAVNNKFAQIKEMPEFPEYQTKVYFDTEYRNVPGRGQIPFAYGAFVTIDGNQIEYISVIVKGDSEEDEKAAFIEFTRRLQEATNNFYKTGIFHYSSVDKRVYFNTAKRHGVTSIPKPEHFVDLLPYVRKCFIIPKGYGLKTIATLAYEEDWITKIKDRLIPLHGGTAVWMWRKGLQVDHKESDSKRREREDYLRELEAYNNRDIFYLFLLAHNLPGAKRIIRDYEDWMGEDAILPEVIETKAEEEEATNVA